MNTQSGQRGMNEPERHVQDGSLGLNCRIYGHAPVQADGRLASHPFYFRARGSGWSFTLCINADIDPAALQPGDQPEFFTDGEFLGFALWGDFGDGFDASVMPYEEAERLIRQCAAEFLAADG